jgi:hypothetical protein
MGRFEGGIGNAELEEDGENRKVEFGSWTRRRPIGRDYAAAKDAATGS